MADTADAPVKNNDQVAINGSGEPTNKIHVSNLNFITNESDLRELFGDGVTKISIPSRKVYGGIKRRGYAFVDFDSSEQAEEAVKNYNGHVLHERPITVALATSTGPHEKGSKSANSSKRPDGPSKLQRKYKSKNKSKATNGQSADNKTAGNTTNGEAKADSDDADDNSKPKEDDSSEGKTSKTAVFVYNIPFEFNDEKLKNIFSDYEPISARVALRQLRRFQIKYLESKGEQRKCRGYGFVDFKDTETQAKVVEEMNDKVIEGRNIIVRVAIDKEGVSTAKATKEQAEAEKEKNNENIQV